MTMTKAEKQKVQEVVEDSGMDYAFLHGSGFTEIKDKKFHELREAYLDALKELKEYIFA